MKKIFTLVLTSFLILGSLSAQTGLTEAVDFTITDLDENEINLFEVLEGGQYVMIDFFAYWCGPCCGIAPELKEIYHEYGENTGDLFLYSVEYEGTNDQVIEFETNCGALHGQPTGSGLEGNGAEGHSLYGIGAFPTIILIHPDGTIIENDIWPFTADIAREVLTSAGVEATPSNNIDLTKVEGINISPNPANEFTYLDFDLIKSGNVQLDIFSIIGEKIYSNTIAAKNGNNQVKIETSNFQSGVYMVNISRRNDLLASIKLVIE